MISNVSYKKGLGISYLLVLGLFFFSLFELSNLGRVALDYNFSASYVSLLFLLFFGLFLFITFEVLYFYYKFDFVDFFKYFDGFSNKTLYFGSLILFIFIWVSYAIYFYLKFSELSSLLFHTGILYFSSSLVVLVFSFKLSVLVKSFLFLGFTFFCLAGIIGMFVFFNGLILGELIFISNFIYLFKVLGFFSLLFSYVGVIEK
jgi:hypothetical protein